VKELIEQGENLAQSNAQEKTRVGKESRKKMLRRN
jgi:hypothetical protein